MSESPFQIHEKDGFVELVLNTPGSSVNIFDYAAAVQLKRIMDGLDPKEVRAVVFRSSKTGSFINGVGLLLASVVKCVDDAVKLTSVTRAAFDCVRNSSIPTIAAIEGNCYGCGVEFVLNCDYRVAADTFDTHFYMTEINDYLFIPAFGGTQNLPPLLGLEKATDFVIWGEKWTGRQAKKYGLIHRVLNHKTFDEELTCFLRKVGRKKSRIIRAVPIRRKFLEQTKQRILSLPPSYQKVYRACFDLMVSAARKSTRTPSDYKRELVESAKSVMESASKSALSFFFIRQAVRGLCLSEEKSLGNLQLLFLADNSTELNSFRKDILGRKLRENVTPQFAETGIGIKMALRFVSGMNDSAVSLYSPVYRGGMNFFEVALKEKPNEEVKDLFRFLSETGFSYVFTTPKRTFALNQWLAAYLSPLVAYCLEGGDVTTINSSLRDFGFVRRPGYLLRALHREHSSLIETLRPRLPPAYQNVSAVQIVRVLRELESDDFDMKQRDRRITDSLCLSLLGETERSLSEKTFAHPTLIDLMAREVFDFPLRLKSLCSFLTQRQVESFLKQDAELQALIPAQILSSAHQFLSRGRNYYLSA